MQHTLRMALRGLGRAPGAALVAMLTLGIGLAAAVALLGVVDSGTRSLPVPDGGNVVALEVRNARGERVTPPAPLAEWTTAPGIAASGGLRMTAGTLVSPTHGAIRERGAALDPAVLRLLAVPPAIGRFFGDDAADAQSLLLGWRAFVELGADPALLGSRLDVDGEPHTVVGVMPEGFGFPENHAYWTVLASGEAAEVVARLARRADRDAAASALAARLDALAEAAGAEDAPHRVTAVR